MHSIPGSGCTPKQRKGPVEIDSRMNLERMSWIAGIFAAIVAVLAWLVDRDTIFAFCNSCEKIVAAPLVIGFEFLTHPITWPIWALILLLLFGMLLVGSLRRFGSVTPKHPICSETENAREKPLPPPPAANPRTYTNDEIFGVKWSWQWLGHQFGNLAGPFCPRPSCLCRLDLELCRDPNMYYRHKSMTPPIALVCPHCGFNRNYEFDLEELKQKTMVEIERRINTGECYFMRGSVDRPV